MLKHKSATRLYLPQLHGLLGCGRIYMESKTKACSQNAQSLIEKVKYTTRVFSPVTPDRNPGIRLDCSLSVTPMVPVTFLPMEILNLSSCLHLQTCSPRLEIPISCTDSCEALPTGLLVSCGPLSTQQPW